MKDVVTYLAGFKDFNKMGSYFDHTIKVLTPEECISEYKPSAEHYNPNGILHGGALYTVMDSDQGAFIHFDLDPKFKFASTGTATIKYLAPLLGGLITIKTTRRGAEGRKIYIFSEARNDQGHVVATLDEIWIGILK